MLARSRILAACLFSILIASPAAAQVITPFSPRFSTKDTGDIALVANTVLQPDPADAGAVNARNGIGTRLNNNNFVMLNVDVDGDAATFNSSRADLNLPSGTTVLFAGLYWGADSNSATRNQVLFQTPASGGYLNLTGVVVGAVGADYQAFTDVTPLVQAAGTGTYAVANVQATVGATDKHGGWAIVVVYRAPGLPAKDLTVFDGFARVANIAGANDVSIPISGFTAPPSGPVNATVGVVGYEGDRAATGDSVRLNGTALGDARNPTNNFFNSSISSLGAQVMTKSPNHVNQLGFDANMIAAANIVPNGATSATVDLTTGGETFFPGVVFTGIDLFSPAIESTKSFTDLNGGQIIPGDVIEYEITMANGGQDAATALTLIDPIPVHTVYVPGSLTVVAGPNAGVKTDAAGDDQAEFDAANNRVIMRLGTGASGATGGTLGIGETTSVRFRVIIAPGTPNRTVILNQATSQFTGDTTGIPLSADTNELGLTVNAQADLILSKRVTNETPNVGDTISFTLSLSNLGPLTATGVVVQDSLPAGLSFVSASASRGTYNNATGAWTVGTLDRGAMAQLVIQATVTSPAPSTNVATATSVVADPNPANNTASAVVTPVETDLALEKTADNATPNVGDVITFTLSLTSNGPASATNVQVSDPLPSGLVFQSATPSQGSYDSVTGIWLVGALDPGAPETLTITAGVASASPTTNSAVASADQYDPDATNNSASVVTTPQRADLAISKTVDDAAPPVGATVTYTITLSNLGPNAATGVTVQDTLPAGVSFASAAPSQGTFDSGTGVWTVGTVANGATATLTIQAIVTAPAPGINVATVSGSDQFDPGSGNNSSSAAVTPPQADLSLTKTASDTAPNVGDVITYTMALTNNGPDAATNAAVSEPLPAGLSFLSATPSQGAYDNATGLWAVGTLASSADVTLMITARVDAPLSAENSATATASEFDSAPASNTSSAAITPPQADVTVTKSVSNATPTFESAVSFTVQVTNDGPDGATGVTVHDQLPTGLALVSASPSLGTYDPGPGVWTVGSLSNGATATLTVQAVVADLIPSTNFATASAEQFDPAPGNDTASALVTPTASAGVDIAVAIDASIPSTVTGDVVMLTATATNIGSSNATGVVLSVPLPANLTVIGANPAVGSYDPATGTWTLGTVPTGSTATLQIDVRITAAVPVAVTATKVAVVETDTDLSNDSASTSLNARNWSTFLADLVLEGQTAPAVVAPGGVLAYDLVAVNRGPTYVVDLSISGAVPAGTTFVGAVPSEGGVCTTPAVGGVGTVTCTWLGATMLESGAQRTVTIGVRANADAALGSSITGSFLVSSMSSDYYDPSNRIALTTSIGDGEMADLAVSGIMRSEGVFGTALAVPIGASTPMRFTVTNNGPSASAAARYLVEVPEVDLSGIQIESANVSQGAVAVAGASSAEWQVGPLAPGESARFDLSLAMQSMRATTVAMQRIDSAPGDPNSANDRATLTLDGTGHPDGGERWAAIGNVDGVGLKEIVVGAGRLETPQVRIYNGDGSDTGVRFYAYDRNFQGGVRVATCDVDSDGVDEIVTGPGIGPGPHVRVLRMQGQVVTEVVGFYAFDPSFSGGVFVACADVDSDGRPDVIASMGDGGSEVRVFDVGEATATEKASFVAYEPSFLGGARIASVGTNEPGGTQYQIVTVPGPGRPLELRTWAVAGASATMAGSVPVTGPEYQLGAFVDVADLDADGRPEAVLSTDRGIPALVGALTIDSGQFFGVFQPFGSSFLGGAHIALGDIDANGQPELVITPGTGGRPILDAYTVGSGLLFRYRLTPIELP